MPKMGLWLFHRKIQKRSRSGANLSDPDMTSNTVLDPSQPRSHTIDPSMTQQTKRQRTVREPNKLHRRNRAYSFSPGRKDSIHLAGRRSRDDYGNSSREWQRVPTLPRHKSSKRRKIDRGREAEIKAMSRPAPLRPATNHWTAGRPLKEDSRHFKNGVFPRQDHPPSEISLPSVASLRSSMSSDSEYASWKVSALNSLTPRPTLRYSTMPAYAPIHGSGPERTKSQRRKLSERPPIPEATLRAHKRVDDLADDLSASDIRELMERDKRRRERRKQKEQERMERRLARQARNHQQHGEPVTNLERGVLGRELVGLGIEPESAVVTSSRPRSPQSGAEQDQAPTPAERSSAENSHRSSPLELFHRPDSAHVGLPTPPRDSEDPATEHTEGLASPPAPSPSALSRRISSISRRKSDRRVLRKKSRSDSPPLTRHNDTALSPMSHLRRDDTSTTQKSSETGASGRAARLSWSAIFKWPGRNKRHADAGPSSFSNTSRDSMQAAAAAAYAAYAASQAQSGGSAPIAPNITFIPPPRDGAPSVPRRTVSRFREDLPELPLSRISPSPSQARSPAAEERLPTSASEAEDERLHRDTAHAAEADRSSPISAHHSSIAPSPEPPSVSMASIDSEGSWFGGGISGSRRRTRMNLLSRQKQPVYQHSGADRSGANDVEDDLGSNEDEDSRIDPRNTQSPRSSVGEPDRSSDVEMINADEGEATWGTLPRTPTVVHHRAQKVKSSEGLLNSLYSRGDEAEDDKELRVDEKDDDSDLSSPHSPVSPTSDEGDSCLQRATSINLGRNRHISAGSAKLLELAPRPSLDSRRRSGEPKGTISQ